MKSQFQWLRKRFSVFLVILTFLISTGLISPAPANALSEAQSLHAEHHKILSDKHLLQQADKFLQASPKQLCVAYLDADSETWSALEKSAGAAFTVADALTHAAAAGAGTLTGYAGIASAVSQLGLGGVTTAVAGFMGSHAAGAAATSLVTSAIGGPLVMGALLIGGAGFVGFEAVNLGKVAAGKMRLDDWAEHHCSDIVSAELKPAVSP